MTDQKKTKAQLIEELNRLRARVDQFEAAGGDREQLNSDLRQNKEHFRRLFERAPMGYQSLDSDGRFIEVNPAWLETLGYERHEVIGKWFGDFLAPEYVAHFKKNFPRFKKAGEVHDVQFEMICKDGSRITVSLKGCIGHDEAGNFKQTHGMLHDITERAHADKLLRESEARFRTLYESMSEGVCHHELIFNAKGKPIDYRIIDVNPAYESTLGLKRSAAVGQLASELYGAGEAPYLDVYAKVTESGKPTYFETYFPPMDKHFSVLAYSQGPGKFVTVFSDITQRKRTEVLTRLQRDLAHALNSAVTVEEAVELCLDTAIEATGMDSGGLYLVDQETGDMSLVHHRGLSDEFVAGASHFAADSSNTRLVMAGSPVYIQHGQLVKQMGRKAHREDLGIISVLPVAHDSRVVACLNVASHTLTEIPETGRNLLEAIAAEIGSTISRLRGREALIEAEAHYRMMFDNTPSAVAVYQAVDDGRDFMFVDFNRAGEIAESIKKDELIGRKVTEVFPGVDEFGLLDVFRRVWKTGQSEDHPISIYEDDRIAGWRDNYVYKLPSGEIVAIYEDVTERKQAEEALAASEERYQEVFNTVQEGIGIVDENEIIRFANPAYAAIFEEDSVQQIVGHSLLDYIPQDQREIMQGQIDRRRAAETTQYELDIVTRKGTRKTLLLSVSPRYDPDEQYRGAIGAVLNITARKRAEDEIRKFKTISDTASYGTAIADLEGNILYVNESFAEMHGYTCDELLGKPLSIFHSDEHLKAAGCIQQVLQREGSYATVESTHLRRDRQEFPILVSGTIIPGEDGSPQFIAVTAIDITETRRLQEFAERAQRLETAGRIAGQVAHDFNNLLGPLVAYPEFIKEELGADHKVATYLDAMEVAAQQMADINQQLLTLGRRGHYNLEPLNLNTVVRQVLKQLHPHPSTLTIETELGDDLMNVKAGVSQIFRVIANLASNAMDATDGIGALAIKTENWYADDVEGKYGQIPRGEYVKLTVTDTGCGIVPEAQANIFEPFFTTKKASRRRGSGLGLSVVHAVVRDHDGYIDLESTVGVGTSIYIYLPITREQTTASDDLAAAGGSEKILVVDDDQIQREVTLRLLQKLGYQVEVVQSGEQAVEYLKHGQCDLLLLDMIMPGGIDGAETLRQALEINPELKAVIVSGYAESGRMGVAQALGAGAFLKKPITLKSIATAVRTELDRARSAVPVH